MTDTKYTIGLIDRATRTANKIQRGFMRIKMSAEKASNSINSMGAIISGAVLARGVSKAVDAWDAQEQAIAQVNAGLVSTKNISGKTLDELLNKARQLQKQTLFGDETIMKGVTSQILTFTNITGNAFDRTQKAALDVTTKLYGTEAGAESLRSTTIQLAKALNDPVSNLGALGRSGIQFSASQKELIKTFAKTGRIAEAQSIILGEIESQYGGASEAAAKAGKGGLVQLQNRIGDITEIIGGVLFESIQKVNKVVEKLVDWIEKNKDRFIEIVRAVITFTTVTFGLVAAIKILNIVLATNPIMLVIMAIAALVTVLVMAWRRSEKFRMVLSGIWNVMKTLFDLTYGNLIPVVKRLADLFGQLFKTDGAEGFLSVVKDGILKYFRWLLSVIGSLSKAINFLFKGEFKQALDAVTGGLLGMDTTIVDAFKKGAESASGIIDKKTGIFGETGLGGLSLGLSPEAQKLQAKGVVSGGIKTFNININQLTGVETLSTTTVEESSGQIGNSIVRALTEALADIKNID